MPFARSSAPLPPRFRAGFGWQEHCVKDMSTYWLWKGAGEDELRLFDLAECGHPDFDSDQPFK